MNFIRYYLPEIIIIISIATIVALLALNAVPMTEVELKQFKEFYYVD